eukprot:tig00000241_g20955.t1
MQGGSASEKRGWPDESSAAESDQAVHKRQRAAALAGQQPGAAEDLGLSALERLPDDLLKSVVGFLGVRDAWACRLPLVSRRLREVLAATEFGALVVRRERIGSHRFRDVEEEELRAWALRLQSGALRLASLEFDLWRSAVFLQLSLPGWIHPSLLNPQPAKPFFSFASSIQGLRRFVVWHGDVVSAGEAGQSASAASAARHGYVGALLEALAPVAGTLEELSVRLQTRNPCDRDRLPEGEARGAIVAGLGRLTALRSLDLADCIGVSAELLKELWPALRGLRSLRIAHAGREEEHSEDYYYSASALASAVERLYPVLEELHVTFRLSYDNPEYPLSAPSLAAIGRMRALRALSLKATLVSFPEVASPQLESLALDSWNRRNVYYGGCTLFHDLSRLEGLRALTLAGDFQDWENFVPPAKLRSLTLCPSGDHTGFVDGEYLPPAEVACLLPRLAALERLSLHFRCDPPASGAPHLELADSLEAFAAALPSAPALRSLSVAVSNASPYSRPPPEPQPAVSAAAAALLTAARDTLEEYDRELLYPSEEESAALAACTRLRRALLTLAVPAATAAAEGLAALAPLASMAARPAPGPGSLVLLQSLGLGLEGLPVRGSLDWGPLRPLLAPRWRLH